MLRFCASHDEAGAVQLDAGDESPSFASKRTAAGHIRADCQVRVDRALSDLETYDLSARSVSSPLLATAPRTDRPS